MNTRDDGLVSSLVNPVLLLLEHLTYDLSVLQPLKDVLSKVIDGYRMDMPDRCPEPVYKLMKKCWEIDAAKRLSFKQVLNELHDMKLPQKT